MHAQAAESRRRRTARPRTRSGPAGDGAPSSAIGNRTLTRLLAPVSRAAGSQPEPYVRAVLQSFLATDLGDVRVHTSPEAGAVLDEIGGDAATLGRTILMRPEFSHASTLPGRVLLLHELMHVAQQGRSPQLARPHELSHDETADGHEREAQRTALALATRSPQPMGATT